MTALLWFVAAYVPLMSVVLTIVIKMPSSNLDARPMPTALEKRLAEIEQRLFEEEQKTWNKIL